MDNGGSESMLNNQVSLKPPPSTESLGAERAYVVVRGFAEQMMVLVVVWDGGDKGAVRAVKRVMGSGAEHSR
jgi:hypothetical protein